MKQQNKKVAILVIDGIGMTNSWQNNAFASARPENFNKYWSQYEHYLINSSVEEGSRDCTPNLEIIAFGESREKEKNQVSKINFFESKNVNDVFQNAAEKHSYLHLIGTISKDDEISRLEDLIALLKIARQQKVYNVFIHLLIDDSFRNPMELNEKIKDFEASIAQLGIGEIVSMAGQNLLRDESRKNAALSNIMRGNGQYCISPGQALAKIKSSRVEDMDPVCFKKENGTFFHDFDSVFFYNRISDPLVTLIESFAGLAGGVTKDRAPQYLKIGAMFDTPVNYRDKITFAFERIAEKDILTLAIENNYKPAVIANSRYSRQFDFLFPVNCGKYYLRSAGNNSSEIIPLRVYQEAIDKAVRANDFILIHLDTIVMAGMEGNYKEILEVVRKIDQFIGVNVRNLLQADFLCAITSTFGLAERVTKAEKDGNGRKGCAPTTNSLPLIFVSDQTENQVQGGNLLIELLDRRKDSNFLHQKLMEILQC